VWPPSYFKFSRDQIKRISACSDGSDGAHHCARPAYPAHHVGIMGEAKAKRLKKVRFWRILLQKSKSINPENLREG
jgi:hypothetical protein